MRVDNQIISLDPFITQESPNKRKFSVIGVEKDLTVEPEWINQTEKYHWIFTIKFSDNGQRVSFIFDYYDQCLKKVKFQFGNPIDIIDYPAVSMEFFIIKSTDIILREKKRI